MDFNFELFEDINESKDQMMNQFLTESSGSNLNKDQIEKLKTPQEIVYGMKDSVIFLVDSKALQFNNENIERSNLELVKDAYLGLMRRKVVFHSADKTGMIVFNCGLMKNRFETKGVYILDELDSVSAEKILKAQNMEQDLNNLIVDTPEQDNLLDVSNLNLRRFGFAQKISEVESIPKNLFKGFFYLQPMIILYKMKLKEKNLLILYILFKIKIL